MNQMFHHAKWTTSSFYRDMYTPRSEEATVRSAYVRKEFEVTKPVKSAELYICALGLGTYTINGEAVTDGVLSTPFTVYDKRVLYHCHEITHLLKDGTNCLGIHLGNGFYNNNMEAWKDKGASWRDVPKVIFSIHMVYEDGTEGYVDSDSTVKTFPGPALFNHMREGEMFDARLLEEGFDKPGFDDAHWLPAKKIHAPGGKMEPVKIPPIRIVRELKPVQYKNGIYDFGVNISGWAKIKVKTEAGREITLRFDECLNEDGTKLNCERVFHSEKEMYTWHGVNSVQQREYLEFAHKDIYIAKGGAWEEWHPSFCYHGFRYVKVENAPEDFEITAQFVHTDLEEVGTFWCNDEKINILHDMSIRSLLSNNVGIPTDCPHREQNGWAGDAYYASGCGFINYDMYDYFKSWILNYKDLQRTSGQLPAMIPTAAWGFNWGSSPLTDGAIMKIPYNGWLYTGRTDMIEELYENMAAYLEYVESIAEDGLVEYGIFADWSWNGATVTYPVVVRDTLVTYYNCMLMSKLSNIIGKPSEYWIEKAQYYKMAWKKHFAEQEELWKSQTFLVQSIYYGIWDGEETSKALKALVKLIEEADYHFSTGVCGCFCMLTVLSENGYGELLYKMIMNETYPSYWYWVKNGLTTMAEDWDMTRSQNHQMFCEVDHWFYRYVGGIKFTDEGLCIQPMKLDAVSEVKVKHRDITVEIHGEDVTVTVPCKAHIKIGNVDTFVEKGNYHYTW